MMCWNVDSYSLPVAILKTVRGYTNDSSIILRMEMIASGCDNASKTELFVSIPPGAD